MHALFHGSVLQTKGAFLWYDPDYNQWSKIIWIMVDQTLSRVDSSVHYFDLPWSEWSRITDPDLDIPKERTPKKVLIVAHLNEIHHEWNYHVLDFQYFKEIWDLSWISNCKRFLDCVHLFQLRVVKWMIMPLQRYVHIIYYFCFFQFSISN